MFDDILERLSSEIAQKILEMTEAKVSAGLSGRGALQLAQALGLQGPRRRGRPPKHLAALALTGSLEPARKGKIKRDMRCRVAGCKNRSKGPGFGYMCEEHLKLPKAEQRRAQEAYRARKAGK